MAEDSAEQEALATELIHYSEEVKRTRNRERYVTRTLLGYEDSAEARAERAEAEVAALKEKVAELRERNGKLEGKVEVFERLFSIVEARPKQCLCEVHSRGDTDDGSNAFRSRNRHEAGDPAPHGRADDNLRTARHLIKHGQGIFTPLTDGAIFETT